MTTTPTVGTATVTSSTPGSPVNALASGLTGGYISNPTTASLPIYVDPVTSASTTFNGTSMEVLPGQTFYAISNSTLPVSVASADASHQFVAVQWI